MNAAGFAALFGLYLRSVATKGRLIGISIGGLLLLGLGLAISDGPDSAAMEFVTEAGLRLVVPVVALAFGASCLGDPASEGSLGFVLLTPRPRWQLAVPPILATWIVCIPLAGAPLVGVALVNGLTAQQVAGVAVAASVGVMAYSSVFAALGVLLRRAMLFGLLYVVVWEGILAGLASGLSRVSIRVSIESLLAAVAGESRPRFGLPGGSAIVALALVTFGGIALTTWFLRRHVART